MNDRIYPVTVSDAAEMIAGKRALILCHVNPDGDALGSATALLELLKLTGGGGCVVTPSPVSERLAFITGGADTSYKSGMESEYDIILSVDTASPNQFGDLSHLADKVALSFDHHESCTLYSPHVLYGGAAAAALVIFDLLLELEQMGRIKGDTSRALRRIYAALSSDTGSFKYANATPEAFSAAAQICLRLKNAPAGDEAPIDGMIPSDISAALFDNVSKKDVAARQLTYKNLRYICGTRVAVSTVSYAEMTAAGLKMDDLSCAVDCVRSIDGTVAGIVLKQSAKDTWRGSSRANTEFDLSVPAAALGGGGHKRAAGFTVTANSADAAVEIVEKIFGDALLQEGFYE